LAKAMKVVKANAGKLGVKDVVCDENIAKVSVVGIGMRSHSGIASKMFSTLAKNKINIDMISTSEIKISVVVAGDKGKLAAKVIHKAFGLGKK
jgi:aspartate kinase